MGCVRWWVYGCRHVCELMVCVKVCKGTFCFVFVCLFFFSIFITCRFGAGVRENTHTCEKVHLHQLYNIRNETLLMGKYMEQRKYT